MTNWPAPQPYGVVYIIGDVHGCAGRLQALLEAIDADAQTLGVRAELVFVGDYIDRGEHSADVLRFLRQTAMAFPGDVTCLAGNHEQMLLDFLDDPGARGGRWLRYGGAATLASFGLAAPAEGAVPSVAGLEDLAAELRGKMGAGLVNWVTGLPLWWNSGNVWAVHAGADPNEDLETQPEEVLLWGIDSFHTTMRRDGQWVVAGHTPVDIVTVEDGRILIDTGAVYGGPLTAIRLTPDGDNAFLQVE